MNRLKLTFGSLYIVLLLLLLLLLLRHCDSPIPTDDEQIARQTGNMGELKVTLLWDMVGDIDLHVIEPNGTHIWYDDKEPSTANGKLDVDNVEGGPGSAENIYWDNPPKGTYKLFVHYYRKSTDQKIPCKVLIFKRGELINEYTFDMTTLNERKILDDIVVE